MNFIQHTRAAHDQLTRQPAATPFHVSLYWALFFEWNASRFPESLAIDHDHLMHAAHIGSIKTYRATLYDLENWGLLAYQPSKSKYTPSRCFMSDLLGAEVPPVKDPTEGKSAPGKNQSTQGTTAPGTHPAPGPDVHPIEAAPGAEVTQNAYIERLNGSFRWELLDAHLFRSLAHMRQLVDEWTLDYNTQRPHQALNFMTSIEFK